MPLLTACLWFLIASLLAQPSLAMDAAPETRQQRADFLAAEQALRRGDLGDFARRAEALRDYPLHPYLRYQQIERRIDTATEDEVAAFLTEHAGTPLADRLHQRWIQSLAQRKRWETLLRYYPARLQGAEFDCHRRRALYNTGRQAEALDGIEDLWLVARSQPAACDPLFSTWQQRGGVTPALAWERFRLAMGANEVRLARYLVRFMDEQHQEWAELWLRVHSSPGRLLDTRQRPASVPVRNDILVHGVRRMVRADVDQAIAVWDRILEETPGLSVAERAEVDRSLAMALAVRGHPQALERLLAVDEATSDTAVQEWRVRVPLGQQDWQGVLDSIGQMAEVQREAPDWRYWQARALEELGQRAQAEEIYLDLAMQRGYYSFLAADRLERPYELRHAPLSQEDAAAVDPAAYPGILRALELYAIGRMVDARREWHYATRDMADWQLHSVATLARDRGWHDRAILTVARTDLRDDLDLRFPTPYREQILEAAKANDIDPALAFALIRQESAFSPDARSSAGALGLMQLMPATARRLAAYLNVPLDDRGALDIRTNLRLGMAYLRQLLDRYGHQVPALAAYNAGPHRVDRWLPAEQLMSADLWTEVMPFRETRNYVQNVMYFSAIYERRLDLPPGRLAHRMPAVAPRNARLTRNSTPAASRPLENPIGGKPAAGQAG